MVNYWAIAIGINQYQLFQPLSCAQADAEAIRDFLVTDAGFLPQNCLLMTNTSPAIGEKSSYPTKEGILLLLEELAANSWQPGDCVWFFFSGYGVNLKNQDYIMPVEADPDFIAETGIEVRSLMQSLQVAGIRALFIFDINRAFGTQADAPVGQEIIELAQELQMGAILSCQPEEFSHESSDLGHGIFTAALLEALRSGKGSNLKDLGIYLSSITPKLCQHHWRPQQNPVTVIPQQSLAILPALATEGDDQDHQLEGAIFSEESFVIGRSAPPLGDSNQKAASTAKAWWGVSNNLATTLNPPSTQNSQDTDELRDDLITSREIKTGGRFIPPANKAYTPQNKPTKTSLWKQFILWSVGGIVIVSSTAAFFLRNQEIFRFKQSSAVTQQDTPILQASPVLPAAVQPTPTPVQAVSNDAEKRKQAILDLAKMSLNQNQASDLREAIAAAKKIKPGEPFYDQAQDNIQIWSQMIFDLAKERAQQKQYSDAIAAAQLVAPDEPIYPQAQAAISQWQQEAKQYLSNLTLLDAANALIKPGQASSYNRAIDVAKKVPPGQPGYDIAQKSINQWSEKILELAKNRAAQGDFSAAIATAALVPEVTTAYEDAQDAIQKWQTAK
ncbi:MAG TPA: caspase family protein [Nostocaceae cyanobacterium]|nr:caspase family protein [Nostocaceae cyanobacterium]